MSIKSTTRDKYEFKNGDRIYPDHTPVTVPDFEAEGHETLEVSYTGETGTDIVRLKKKE